MSSALMNRDRWWEGGGYAITAAVFTPLRALMALPVLLLLMTLGAMLFRPPDVELPDFDRVLFVVLVGSVVLRALVLRRSFSVFAMSWPMLGLSLMAIAGALSHPYEAKLWSVIAAKFIVPFTLFHLAGLIFEDEKSLRWLERFAFVTLAYLSFTAISSFAGFDALVFPRFILDPTVGVHADRARGPFLQAVANGVTLNLLGLLAMDRYRKGSISKIWGTLLVVSLPLAIIATKTRAVWLSFAISVACLFFGSPEFRVRAIWKWLMVVAVVIGASSWAMNRAAGTLGERLQDSSPIEFRMAAYRAGWTMFLERPLAGWGTNRLQSELASRIDGFRGEKFVVHNTYLEILMEHGVVGFALYVWMMFGLVRLGRVRAPMKIDDSYAGTIQRLWPLLLGVYLVNATFVVMNYQFVNGLVFMLAGILAARQRSQQRIGLRYAAAL